MRNGGLHVLASRFAVSMCCVSVGLSGVVIAFSQLRCCLKVVVRRRNVMRRREMMVLARHVSFGVSHDDVLQWMNG